MRFRVAGRNWEGREWELAPCLIVLAVQVDGLHPERHLADGTVASKRHDQVSPSSDHRPKPYVGKGIVRAIDFGETTEDDAFAICESIRLSEDPRVKYVIHEGRMFSSYPKPGYPPYTWRPYPHAPHGDHGHVSTLSAYDNDQRPWQITKETDMPLSPKNWDEEDWKAWQAHNWGAGYGDKNDPNRPTASSRLASAAANSEAALKLIKKMAGGVTLTPEAIDDIIAEQAESFGLVERDIE